MQINVTPVSKPRMTQRDKWAKRPCVVKYHTYCDFVRKIAQNEKFKPSGAMLIEFYLPLPKSYSKKKREELMGQPHEQKPDIDNLVKGLLDALLKEDKGVHTIIASKSWAEHGSITVLNLKDYEAYT